MLTIFRYFLFVQRDTEIDTTQITSNTQEIVRKESSDTEQYPACLCQANLILNRLKPRNVLSPSLVSSLQPGPAAGHRHRPVQQTGDQQRQQGVQRLCGREGEEHLTQRQP